MSNGAVYIVTQDPRYLNLLRTSAESLKRHMPGLPITVFSQFPVENPFVDNVFVVEPGENGFFDKARLVSESPYERTLLIDTDTFVVEPFPELFELLDRFDCAATHEEYVNTDWFNHCPRPDIPDCFPEFNTGVLLFKRSVGMDHFLEHWAELYREHLAREPQNPVNDQPFFRAAAYYGDVRIATLPREYNCKFRGQGYLNGPVKILHGHVHFELKPERARHVTDVLNASKRPRVYIAGEVYEQKLAGRLVGQRKAHKVGSFPELPGSITLMRATRLKQVIQERGMKGALARVLAGK